MNPIVAAALITVGGVALTTLIGLYIKRIENKYEVDAQFRVNREKTFTDFVGVLDTMFTGQGRVSDARLTKAIVVFKRQIMFWASAKTINRFNDSLEHIKEYGATQTVGSMHMTTVHYGRFIIAVRKDLGLSSRGLDVREFVARHTLRHPDLLLRMVKENPDLPMEELAKMEAALEGKSNT